MTAAAGIELYMKSGIKEEASGRVALGLLTLLKEIFMVP